MKTIEEKTISSEKIFEGKILNLRKDIVTSRQGQSTREIVEHKDGVVIVGITKDGMVPMVHQYRKPAEQVVLEVPAGLIDDGEAPETAALRELKEETGYTAGLIKKLGAGYSSVGYATEVLHMYLAEDLSPGEQELDPGESIDIEMIDMNKLYKMAINGDIIDMKSITAIMLAKEAL